MSDPALTPPLTPHLSSPPHLPDDAFTAPSEEPSDTRNSLVEEVQDFLATATTHASMRQDEGVPDDDDDDVIEQQVLLRIAITELKVMDVRLYHERR